MIRSALAAAVLCLAAAPAYADWQTVNSAEGRYSVSFPGAPEAKDLNSAAFTSHTFLLQQPNVTLISSYRDYKPGTPIDAQKQMQTERDTLVSVSKATLKSSGDAAVARGATPVPAMLFTFQQGPALCDSLVAVENLRIYQLIACHPADGDAADTDRFIKSFALTAN
jgi:hypothetical protein